MISTKAEYGVIPHGHWFQPEWIDEERAAAERIAMVHKKVMYGGEYTSLHPLTPSLSDLHRFRLVSRCACGKWSSNKMTIVNRYRNMCRFNSGVSS